MVSCLLCVIPASEQAGLMVSGTRKPVRGFGARECQLWFGEIVEVWD